LHRADHADFGAGGPGTFRDGAASLGGESDPSTASRILKTAFIPEGAGADDGDRTFCVTQDASGDVADKKTVDGREAA